MTRDPHKILGVTPGASRDEIRRAYLRMVKKYHPDVGGDAWVFSDIQAAYETLTGDRQSASQDAPRAKPTANSPPPDPTPTGAARQRPSPDSTQSAPPRNDGPQAAPRNAGAKQAAGSTGDEFPFPPISAGRRTRRSRSVAGNMFGVALGGAMALAIGWYVVQNRPDLLAWLRFDGSTKPVPDAPPTEAGTPSESTPPPKQETRPANPIRPADGNATSGSAATPPRESDSRQQPQRLPAPNDTLTPAAGTPRNPTAGQVSPPSGEPSAEQPSPPLPPADESTPRSPAATSATDSPAPDQLTGIEALDEDIVKFDQLLAVAQRESTEVRRQAKLEESIEWMQRNCKRSRVRIKFQISDIHRGDGTEYHVLVGTPDPGEYPRIMSYPKIAKMNLDEDDALRLGDQYRLSVEGFIGFQWGTLDPSTAIVFYASECPLAPMLSGAPYGPNFGVFPTDYVYLGKDSLRPAYWIVLQDAKLRIVRAKD